MSARKQGSLYASETYNVQTLKKFSVFTKDHRSKFTRSCLSAVPIWISQAVLLLWRNKQTNKRRIMKFETCSVT